MTLPSDELDIFPDDGGPTLTEPELEVEASETDTTPEEAPEVTPPAAPVNDVMDTVRLLAEQMKADREHQRQQQERQNQPAAPAAWVDPYDRPDIVAKLDDLEDRAGYDSEARNQLRVLRRQLDDERMDYRVGQREQALRAEMAAAGQVDSVTRTLQTEARVYGDLVSDDALTEVQNEIFKDQPAHVRANALQDPSLRALIVQAAAGRRVLSGQVKPGNAPARPAAPPAVRSDSRATAPAKAGNQNWSDAAYMESVMQDAWTKGSR